MDVVSILFIVRLRIFLYKQFFKLQFETQPAYVSYSLPNLTLMFLIHVFLIRKKTYILIRLLPK